MSEPQQTDPIRTDPVFPAGFYKTMFWIAGQLLLLALLVLIYGNFGFSGAWDAFMSIDPAVDKDAIDAEKLKALKVEAFRNFMLAIGAIGAVTGGLVGLGLAAVRTYALHSQAETAKTDSNLSEKKHQAEAFATAIEQLGHDKYPVILGAVYALEALAKASKSLHGPIFETLCAYVRKEAPAPVGDDLMAKIQARDEQDIEDVILEHLQTVAKPDVVVQAILTVVGRRDPARDSKGFRLDLQGTDLRQADLRNGHFEQALFTNTHLTGANLKEAHLEGADLLSAQLEGAGLESAHLEGVILMIAHLEGADLSGAHLAGAKVWAAHLEDAHLTDAHLEGADLTFAHLEGADLSGAHLAGAGLESAHLEGANLRNVSFDHKTDVASANFTRARRIPARPDADFRATVQGTDTATWPNVDMPRAWDRVVKD